MLNRHSQSNLTVQAAFNVTPTASEVDFESAAMPHLNDLYGTALNLLQGHPTKASSAVEETYLRASETFGEFPRGANCKTWLFQILISVVRMARMQQEIRMAEGDGQSTPGVAAAMSRVSPDFQEILLLIDGQGFSYRDTSEILGLPRDVIALNIGKARNQLQVELDGSHSTLAAVVH